MKHWGAKFSAGILPKGDGALFEKAMTQMNLFVSSCSGVEKRSQKCPETRQTPTPARHNEGSNTVLTAIDIARTGCRTLRDPRAVPQRPKRMWIDRIRPRQPCLKPRSIDVRASLGFETRIGGWFQPTVPTRDHFEYATIGMDQQSECGRDCWPDLWTIK